MATDPLLNDEERFIQAIRQDTSDPKRLHEADATMRLTIDAHLSPNRCLEVDGEMHTPLSLAIKLQPTPHDDSPVLMRKILNISATDDPCDKGNHPHLIDHLVARCNAYIGSKKQKEEGISQPEGAPLPLAYAVKCGKPHIVHQLIDLGADVNLQGPDGKTALHEAALLADRKMGMALFQTLLEANANPSIRDHEGNTALNYLTQQKEKSIPCVMVQEPQSHGVTNGAAATYINPLGGWIG